MGAQGFMKGVGCLVVDIWYSGGGVMLKIESLDFRFPEVDISAKMYKHISEFTFSVFCWSNSNRQSFY